MHPRRAPPATGTTGDLDAVHARPSVVDHRLRPLYRRIHQTAHGTVAFDANRARPRLEVSNFEQTNALSGFIWPRTNRLSPFWRSPWQKPAALMQQCQLDRVKRARHPGKRFRRSSVIRAQAPRLPAPVEALEEAPFSRESSRLTKTACRGVRRSRRRGRRMAR
jgi:hypothetical protein